MRPALVLLFRLEGFDNWTRSFYGAQPCSAVFPVDISVLLFLHSCGPICGVLCFVNFPLNLLIFIAIEFNRIPFFVIPGECFWSTSNLI